MNTRSIAKQQYNAILLNFRDDEGDWLKYTIKSKRLVLFRWTQMLPKWPIACRRKKTKEGQCKEGWCMRYCILGIFIQYIDYWILNFQLFFFLTKKSNVQSKLDTFRKRNTNLIFQDVKGNKFKNKLNIFHVANWLRQYIAGQITLLN